MRGSFLAWRGVSTIESYQIGPPRAPEQNHRAETLEADVWGFVSGLLQHPERLQRGLDEMIEQERAAMRGDPEQVVKVWLDKLAEVDQERRGYLRLAAKGHMSDEELDEALGELEDARKTTERELRTVQASGR